MRNIIRLKKNVFDPTHPAIPQDQAINPSSNRLTATLLHEDHPLFQKLRQSFDEKEIRARRIRFDVCGKALYTKHPVSGKQMVLFNVTALSLQLVTKDAREKQTAETDALTARMQRTIDSYFSEQGFSLPCETPEEIERFLNHLSLSVPETWSYFRVITKAS